MYLSNAVRLNKLSFYFTVVLKVKPAYDAVFVYMVVNIGFVHSALYFLGYLLGVGLFGLG